MTLPAFNYIKPTTFKETLVYLKEMKTNTEIMAGGTDLLVQVRAKAKKPDTIVDVKDISDLKVIKETPKDVYIGSTVTFSEILKSNIIGIQCPVLKEAAQKYGSPQIRNIGTIGGNVQTASPAGDGLVALFALEAEVDLISPESERKVLIEDFIRGPQKTSKRPNELLKGFNITKRNWNFQTFFKIGRRNALAISVVNGVINLSFDATKRKITDARIVLGAVAPTPIRLKSAEELLRGEKYRNTLGQEFRDIIKKSISPISDVRASKEYRSYIAGVMCDRIVKQAVKYGGER